MKDIRKVAETLMSLIFIGFLVISPITNVFANNLLVNDVKSEVPQNTITKTKTDNENLNIPLIYHRSDKKDISDFIEDSFLINEDDMTPSLTNFLLAYNENVGDEDENENNLVTGETIMIEDKDTEEKESVKEEIIEEPEEEELFKVNECEEHEMYVSASVLRVRNFPGDESEETIIGRLKRNDKVTVIGEVEDSNWVKIIYEDTEAFVYKNYLIENSVKQEQPKNDYQKTSYNSAWNGVVLNNQNGRITGPSGEESYYNLNMSHIVERLKSQGYEGEYWVREDGVKMFGPYVMVAASFDIRPLGTILETSLGTAIVCDTGKFAEQNPMGLDIAVTW